MPNDHFVKTCTASAAVLQQGQIIGHFAFVVRCLIEQCKDGSSGTIANDYDSSHDQNHPKYVLPFQLLAKTESTCYRDQDEGEDA